MPFRPFYLLFLALLTLTTTPGFSQTGLDPVKPGELLKNLPPAPPNWKLTVSQASHIVQNPPRSLAIREYVLEGEIDGKPASRRVKLTLLDTCGDDGILAVYSEPKPGTQTENISRQGTWLTIGTVRAVQVEAPSVDLQIEALLEKRFLLTISVISKIDGKSETSLAPSSLESWLSKVNVGALKIAGASSKRLDFSSSQTVVMERVDELNPKNSRTFKVALAGEVAEDFN